MLPHDRKGRRRSFESTLNEENDESKSKNSNSKQSTNPQGRQHPPPAPGNVTSQFQTDEENSQQTRKTDATGGRGRVARHLFCLN